MSDLVSLAERLVSEASDGWTGDAVCVDAALAAEAATALQSLAKELAEARAERDAALGERDRIDTELFKMVRRAREAMAATEAAEAASASKDERIRELEAALDAAEPYVELAHSTAQAKDVRAMVWKRLLQIRAARSTKEPT